MHPEIVVLAAGLSTTKAFAFFKILATILIGAIAITVIFLGLGKGQGQTRKAADKLVIVLIGVGMLLAVPILMGVNVFSYILG